MARLFGTAGIRGRYLEKITPELAYRVGLSVAAYVGGLGSATVGYDIRTTSPLLAQLVAAGLMAGGLDAIDTGLVPTPVLAYSVPETKSKAGVMVTASHNPPPDNGIKVFDSTGMEYTLPMERDLEELIFNGDLKKLHASWDNVGRLVYGHEIVEEYVYDILEMVTVDKPRIELRLAVDCANGTASTVTPRILRMAGVSSVISFNCHQDGFFPGRHPEPRPDTIGPYISATSTLNVHGLLAHDGDADRLAIAVPGLGFVKQDLIIALFAWWKLRERKGTVVVSVDVGIEVEEIVERLGGRLVRSKLGKLHEKIRDTPGVILAAEPWKLIDPAWGPWVDGIYQAALFARIAMEEGEPPAALVQRLPFYPSARINVKLAKDEDKLKLYPVLEEKAKSILAKGAVDILEIDGVRITYDDSSWILLRVSGTEPKVRIYAQATGKQRLLELVSRAKELVYATAGHLGLKITGVEEHIDLGRKRPSF
ncbi:MAG: phosphopentomutase/phosphoglucosamine mutase [Desulfurococcales archaeon]|nr:phosphopentomutase/phosphoglucosamine mutase [Desulfurococcales archaeon]